MIEIDGVKYNVETIDLQRSAPLMDKYAKRNQGGRLSRKVIGTYYNYTISFGDLDNMEEYGRLYDVLTAPKASHTVKVPWHKGWYTYEAYITQVTDKLKHMSGNDHCFGDLKAEFIAMGPARTP